MRFAIVTLCFLFMAVAAHAEIGTEPYEYFGFRLGDSKAKVLHVLRTSEKLAAYNLCGYDIPSVDHNKSDVSASITYSGYTFVCSRMFFTNDKLTAILIGTGTEYKTMCEYVEYRFKCKPSREVDKDRTVYSVRKGLTITVKDNGYGHADLFYTVNDNEIPSNLIYKN